MDSINKSLMSIFSDLYIAIKIYIVQNHSFPYDFVNYDSVRRNIFILEIKDLSSEVRMCFQESMYSLYKIHRCK